MQVTMEAKITFTLEGEWEDEEAAQEYAEEFLSDFTATDNGKLTWMQADPIYCAVDGVML